MKEEFERVRTLLVDTVSLLCKNGLTFGSELRVEGVIGITVDRDVFIVHVNEVYDGDSTTHESSDISETASAVLSRLSQPPKHSSNAPSTSSQSSAPRKPSPTVVQIKKEPVSIPSAPNLRGSQEERPDGFSTGRLDGASVAGFNNAGPSGSRDTSNEAAPFRGTSSATAPFRGTTVAKYQGGDHEDNDIVLVNDDEYNDNEYQDDNGAGFDESGVKQEFYDYEEEEMEGEQEGGEDWAGYEDSGEGSGAWAPMGDNSDNMWNLKTDWDQQQQHEQQWKQQQRRQMIRNYGYKETAVYSADSFPAVNQRSLGTVISVNHKYSESQSADSKEGVVALAAKLNKIAAAGKKSGLGGRATTAAATRSRLGNRSVGGVTATAGNGKCTRTLIGCQLCGRQFSNNPNLLRHQRLIHGRATLAKGRPPAQATVAAAAFNAAAAADYPNVVDVNL